MRHLLKPAIDTLPRWKLAGQKPPGTAALQDVEEDRIEDLAGGVDSRSPSLVGRWKMGLQTLPFGIGKIG
jgi:hypothetical protein